MIVAKTITVVIVAAKIAVVRIAGVVMRAKIVLVGMMNNMITKQELIDYCYKWRLQWFAECEGMTQREFDCLIALIEDNDIKTLEQLADYGMEY